jgi:hypothetical protein
MKNKHFLVLSLCLLLCLNACSQAKKEQITFPFYSINDMKESIDDFDKKERFFPYGAEYKIKLFDPNYDYNIKKDSSYYNKALFLEKKLGYFETPNYNYQIYSVLNFTYDFYENTHFYPEYQQWIKSFGKDGIAIDSLQIVYYTSFEGDKQRIVSTILSKEKISTEFNILSWNFGEEDEPTYKDYPKRLKTFKGEFIINNGHFIYKNSVLKPIFFDIYGWGDLHSNIDINCWVVENTQELDINNDGIKDAIFFLKNKESKQCGEEGKYDLLISMADKHGLYTFESTEGLDVQSDKIKITKYERGLKIIIADKNTDKLEFYFQYHNFINEHLKNKFSLEKIEKEGLIIKSNHKNEYIPIRNIISDYLK